MLLAAADKETLDKWYDAYSGDDPLVNKINDAWYTFDCSVKHVIVNDDPALEGRIMFTPLSDCTSLYIPTKEIHPREEREKSRGFATFCNN